jgi:hypothetical protein
VYFLQGLTVILDDVVSLRLSGWHGMRAPRPLVRYRARRANHATAGVGRVPAQSADVGSANRGSGAHGPGADVAEVSAVPVQMWKERARSGGGYVVMDSDVFKR